MTENEWDNLQEGDIIKYINQNDFQNTICKVSFKQGKLTITVIQPGYQGHTLWYTGTSSSTNFKKEDAFNFILFEKSSPKNKERELVNKIKYLDTKWAETRKENKYAMFLLRQGTI